MSFILNYYKHVISMLENQSYEVKERTIREAILGLSLSHDTAQEVLDYKLELINMLADLAKEQIKERMKKWQIKSSI